MQLPGIPPTAVALASTPSQPLTSSRLPIRQLSSRPTSRFRNRRRRHEPGRTSRPSRTRPSQSLRGGWRHCRPAGLGCVASRLHLRERLSGLRSECSPHHGRNKAARPGAARPPGPRGRSESLLLPECASKLHHRVSRRPGAARLAAGPLIDRGAGVGTRISFWGTRVHPFGGAGRYLWALLDLRNGR